MFIDFLEQGFNANADADAIVWRDRAYSYGWLAERLDEWREYLVREDIRPGQIVILEADFSPNSVALLLALLDRGCILVPLTSAVAAQRDEFSGVAQGEVVIDVAADDTVAVERLPNIADHAIYHTLRERGHPGLVLFSSGSTGKSKAAVHDFVPLLEKFRTPRHRLRSISFLLFDHIGGVNTMLYVMSNIGCLITVEDRSPAGVLSAVQNYRVELLPATPTFLNLILISEADREFDLSSLQTVTYGTEPMPHTTLTRFHARFPGVRLVQTYGLSEIGIMRSKSKGSDSLWVKLGGEGFETRVVDGILHVKAASAMLGYLNAPSPFTADGWFNTNDRVEVDGDYFRILGRDSEIINVGGQKVYPAEVESVIQSLDNVAEVTVFGEAHPITGNVVCAQVSMIEPAAEKAFKKAIRKACRERLEGFKVPVKVHVLQVAQHSERFKKIRAQFQRDTHPADGH
jgi:acyl-CoA synthetase (AMP-forming)/AMP-acid ligase II